MKRTLSVSVLMSVEISIVGSYLRGRKEERMLENTPSDMELLLRVVYLFTSQIKISATKGKFGVLKLCMEISRGYPRALSVSVKSTKPHAGYQL